MKSAKDINCQGLAYFDREQEHEPKIPFTDDWAGLLLSFLLIFIYLFYFFRLVVLFLFWLNIILVSH